MTDPAEVDILLFVRLDEFTVRPISHRTEPHFAFNQRADRLVPTQRRMIWVQIILHLREVGHRLLYLRVIPLHLAAKQIDPSLAPDNSEQRVFKELSRSPNPGVSDPERRDAGCFKFVASREKLVEAH